MRSPQAPLHAPRATSDVDTQGLARLGYEQELHRGVGSFSSFAAGFSFVSILTTVFQLFGLGFENRRCRVLLGVAARLRWPAARRAELRAARGPLADLRRDLPVVEPPGRSPVRVVHRLDDDHRPDPHRRGGGHRRAGRAPRDLGRVPGRRRSGSGPVRRVADRCRERGGPRSGDARRDDDREHHERPADGPRDELRRAHRDRRRGRAHRRAVPAAAPQRVRGVHDRRVDEHRAVRVGVPGVLADGRVRDGRLRLGR